MARIRDERYQLLNRRIVDLVLRVGTCGSYRAKLIKRDHCCACVSQVQRLLSFLAEVAMCLNAIVADLVATVAESRGGRLELPFLALGLTYCLMLRSKAAGARPLIIKLVPPRMIFRRHKCKFSSGRAVRQVRFQCDRVAGNDLPQDLWQVDAAQFDRDTPRCDSVLLLRQTRESDQTDGLRGQGLGDADARITGRCRVAAGGSGRIARQCCRRRVGSIARRIVGASVTP